MSGPRFKAGGVGFYCDPVLGSTEVATSKCWHCQALTDIPNPKKIMEYVDICRMCMKMICLNCVGKPCIPHMKKIEEAERAYYSKRQRSMLGY